MIEKGKETKVKKKEHHVKQRKSTSQSDKFQQQKASNSFLCDIALACMHFSHQKQLSFTKQRTRYSRIRKITHLSPQHAK